MRTVGYNNQRDNHDFNGQFKASCQCFATSAWMLLSYFAQSYRADDDDYLERYVDDVSDIVGKPGIGEKIKKAFSFITGNSAYWWQVHQAAIKQWLLNAGIIADVVFKDGNCTVAELEEALKISPVIIGTNKMAGLPGGHIILVIDSDAENFYINDPYGNAMTGYKSIDGARVTYPRNWIKKFIEYNPGGLMRAMWVKK